MKPNFRTCPQCSTRNRLDKEFCVKCGESLEGVQAGDPTATPAKEKVGIVVGGGPEAQNPIVPLMLGIAALATAIAGWFYFQSPPPAAAPPVIPSRATLPSPSPLPSFSASNPGAGDYQTGMTALRAGDFQRAITLFRAALAAANLAEYHLALAEALEKSGAGGQAFVAEFQAAAAIEPRNPRYLSEWAKALNRAGRNPEAIRVYQQSIALQPENLSDLRELANLLMRANDLAAARPILEKVTQLQPDDLAPKQDLARALEATKDLEGAAKQYRDILAAMPAAHLSRALLSEVYMKQNKAADALKLLNDGLALDQSAAVLQREKGRVLDRQGDAQGAIEAYRAYLRLAPGAGDQKVFAERITQLTTQPDGA